MIPDVRLIDAKALQRAFDDAHKGKPDYYCCNFLNNAGNPSTEWDCVDDILENAPTIDAQPVKHGKWITTQKTIDDGFTTCSYCHREFYIDDLVHVGNEDGFCEFCPACGSDNRGDSDADS